MPRIALTAALPLLALAACGKPSVPPEAGPSTVAASPAPAPASRATANASASGGGASAVSESSDLYEFDYSYPEAAGRIPALRAWLDAQRDKARSNLIADARSGRKEAKDGGFEYHPYALGRKWLVVAETPRFLSLSAELYDYQGGAHPNHGYDSLVWDKQAGARLEPTVLFASKAALDAVIQAPFCAILDKERAKRRGAPVNRGSGDMFDECIKPSEQTIILGSTNGQSFDRIGVLVGPYAAGAYAEGDYDITLPITPAIIAAVKPEYRGAFSAR